MSRIGQFEKQWSRAEWVADLARPMCGGVYIIICMVVVVVVVVVVCGDCGNLVVSVVVVHGNSHGAHV